MEWASYNLALGVGAEKIVEELKHNGFEAGRARSPVTDIQLHPIFKAAKTLGGDVQKWESLSEALLELASQSVDLNSVPRMRGLSSEAFPEHYCSRNLPESAGIVRSSRRSWRILPSTSVISIRSARSARCSSGWIRKGRKPRSIAISGTSSWCRCGAASSGATMPRPRACRCSLRDPKAAYLRDVDGHRYIDCALGYGSVVLGHGHPAVADAMRQAARLGGHSTLLNRWHAELAQRFVDMIPAAEMVAFLRTGSDAVSAAVRLARAITKRRVVLHWGLHG
ncbi:aminotransferase class III-fold pyridoxal phosphate-dependent enzyme [Ralstonia nicotianae]